MVCISCRCLLGGSKRCSAEPLTGSESQNSDRLVMMRLRERGLQNAEYNWKLELLNAINGVE